jgi:hypothetical protein
MSDEPKSADSLPAPDPLSGTLHYASRRPRRHWAALVLAVAGSLILGFAVYRVVTTIGPRLPFLAAQRKCMKLTFPPDQVAYEEDHEAAKKLSNGYPTGAGWTTLISQEKNGTILAFYLDPVELHQLNQFIQPNFYPGVLNLDPFPYFLFLHARQAKGGPERLVHIGVSRLFSIRGGADGPLSPGRSAEREVLQWEVVQPGTLFKPSTHLKSGSWGDATLQINMPKPLRLYAGQIDPVDESHFFITGGTPRGPVQIDGWLQNDDTIQFNTQ